MSKTSRSLFLVCLFLALGGCAEGSPPTSRGPASAQVAGIGEGDIIETATGQVVPLDLLMERLRQQEVLYIGEEHHNRFHIEAALSLLRRFRSESRRPVVAMEMFGWDGQTFLDRYVGGGELDRQAFIEQVDWRHNWGGPFEDYEPLVSFAKAEHLPLAALNPPKSLVKSVARNGLAQARHDSDWTRWGLHEETIVDDPLYREQIVHQLRACHDGGPDALYQTMYEASMVRDEGMARTIVSLVEAMRAEKDPLAGPVVSYTGGGHIQYNLPVPKRVARRLFNHVRQIAIYMMSYEKGRLDELQEMVGGKIADYVWLTPVGAQGPPRRCR